MTNSAINPNINEQFPVPGVENDSQVFRDNFATIKSSLTSAKTEIEQFLNHGVRDDTPVTNLNGNVLSTYVRISESDYRHGITGLQVANFDLNYNNGLYQNVKIGADLRINLINFPTDTSDVRKVGKVRLHMSADSTDRKVMFAAANAALKYDESYPLVDSNKITVKGSSTENATIVDIWQVNDGTLTPSVYIKYIGYFQYRTTQPPAPIRYSDNFGSIQNIASFAASTDDTTPGIAVGTRLSSTPKLYVDGTFTAANYNSALGTLTPNQPIAVGSHQFKYTLTDASGYESGLSEPITINIDTTAPAAPTAAPSSYNDAVGSITANSSTALTTDDTRPGIHISANLIDTPQLYVNDAPVAATYESDSTVGTLRPDIALADGSYTFAYSLIDEAGNESGKSPTIAITIDTTLPIINTVTPSWGSELESSEMSADGTITVATAGVENGQTVTVALNAVNYTGTVTNNSTVITIPTADLAALTGSSYDIVTSVKDLAGNAATNNTTSFTVSTVVDGGWDGITQLGPNGLGARLNYIVIDSNNIPIVGGFNNSSQGLITRYDTAYNATKQITLGVTDIVVYGVATDSNNNVLVTGYHDGQCFVRKYAAADLALEWARKLTDTNSTSGSCVAVGPANSVIVTGNHGGNQFGFVAKYDSSGALQWKKTLSVGVGSIWNYTGCSVSTTAIYVAGNLSDGVGGEHHFIAKYDLTGNILWKRVATHVTNTYRIEGIDIDSSENVYLTGTITENNISSAVLIKYDQSGSFGFARKLKHTTVSTYGTAINTNATGDIFVTGYSSTAPYEPFVAKYNSTGQLQWKRTFDGSLSYTRGISTDSTGKIYIAASNQIGSVIGGYIAILDPVDANNISNTTAVGLTLNDGSELAESTLTITDADATTLLNADATMLLDAADTSITDTETVPVVVHERAH